MPSVELGTTEYRTKVVPLVEATKACLNNGMSREGKMIFLIETINFLNKEFNAVEQLQAMDLASKGGKLILPSPRIV